MQSEHYWTWLSCIPEVTPKLYYQILRKYGSPERFFGEMERGASAPAFLPDKAQGAVRAALSLQRVGEAVREMEARGIRAVSRLDAEYPAMLNVLEYPPPVLFVRGSLAGLSKTIGIVGTRRCTRRGAEAARRIAAEMGEAGYTIVSGLARGIDAAAHQGAVDAGAPTVAVLGCGADVIYPPENASLYHTAIKNGAVVSELPPGTQPVAGNFPVRNRIIAALSRGLLVVESALAGGTAISASMAMGLGRDIFAMPGAPYLESAALPNKLIQKGAVPVTCARDILESWGEAGKAPAAAALADASALQLDFLQQQIYALLRQADQSAEMLSEQTAASPGEISVALTMMELSGIIKRVPGGKYGA
jgi:DNA processing protein